MYIFILLLGWKYTIPKLIIKLYITMIIPIGVDCGLASLLKEHNLRTCSLPFDWVVSYGGVSKIFESHFSNYLDITNNLNKIYNISFVHNSFPKDNEKMQRRIERLKSLLETSTTLTFIRKGHAPHHHPEVLKHNLTIKNEIDDANELATFLKNN